MGNYTIVNLLEIDDGVQGRVEGLEGRFGRQLLGSRDLGISHWRYAPNLRTPGGGHRHREQEEAYVERPVSPAPLPGAVDVRRREKRSAGLDHDAGGLDHGLGARAGLEAQLVGGLP
jgi:hypothetical protein